MEALFYDGIRLLIGIINGCYSVLDSCESSVSLKDTRWVLENIGGYTYTGTLRDRGKYIYNVQRFHCVCMGTTQSKKFVDKTGQFSWTRFVQDTHDEQ